MTVKARIVNNVLVKMAMYLTPEILNILENTIQNELVRIDVHEITTLPEVRKNDVEQKNYYIIELFKIKRDNLAPETRYNYLMAIRRLITAIPHKSLDQMDETDIEWYLHQYEGHVGSRGEPIKNTTWNNTRLFISAFFTWMRKTKIIQSIPAEAIPAKRVVRGPIDFFSPGDMIKMRDACRNARERAIIEIFRSTGARIGELTEITMNQVDLKTGDIWIKGEKSGRYRTIYLDEDARYYLTAYLASRPKDEAYLIAKSRAPYGKMCKSSIRTLIKNIAKRAGITCRAYPHKYRKTLGMHLRNGGVDIGTIQEIMGHANPAVTAQYYAQSTPQTLRNIRERVG